MYFSEAVKAQAEQRMCKEVLHGPDIQLDTAFVRVRGDIYRITKHSGVEVCLLRIREQVLADKQVSDLEMSILCSNLARGCEKQYLPEEAKLFFELSDYFKAKAAVPAQADAAQLLQLAEKDLEEGLPFANAAAKVQKDRGALRALTWDEKVTRIVKSLLTRYVQEGDAMLEANELYVCTICGFVYLGNTPPDLCPVCKVPSRKFEKIERS